jgi:hypothetical protein
MISLLLQGGLQRNADISLHLYAVIQANQFTSFRSHKKKKLIRFSQFAESIFFTRAPSSFKPFVASLRG